jgi:hypothetical protein
MANVCTDRAAMSVSIHGSVIEIIGALNVVSEWTIATVVVSVTAVLVIWLPPRAYGLAHRETFAL